MAPEAAVSRGPASAARDDMPRAARSSEANLAQPSGAAASRARGDRAAEAPASRKPEEAEATRKTNGDAGPSAPALSSNPANALAWPSSSRRPRVTSSRCRAPINEAISRSASLPTEPASSTHQPREIGTCPPRRACRQQRRRQVSTSASSSPTKATADVRHLRDEASRLANSPSTSSSARLARSASSGPRHSDANRMRFDPEPSHDEWRHAVKRREVGVIP